MHIALAHTIDIASIYGQARTTVTTETTQQTITSEIHCSRFGVSNTPEDVECAHTHARTHTHLGPIEVVCFSVDGEISTMQKYAYVN